MTVADLGRREGVFIPIDDVEAHAANGWRLIDDLAGMRGLGAGDVVLMAPPAELLRAGEDR